MTAEERIRDRKIGIVGMARSGIAAAQLAARLGGKPFVSDYRRAELLTGPCRLLEEAGISYETDGHTERLLSSDYVVLSPGVSLDSKIVRSISQTGLPIFSEIEFASWVCRGLVVAVTGSNGKTTTTTLIGEMLTAAGLEAFVCGNIGRPFSEVADRIPSGGAAAVEVSTFQLETIADFKPNVALILNLSEDHLDRHGSFEAYKRLKYRIAENQTAEDYLILNLDDAILSQDVIETSAQRRYFSVEPEDEAMTFVQEERLRRRSGDTVQDVVGVDEIRIPGPHNLQNAAAAVAAVSLLEVPSGTMAEVLRSFPGVEHRLEWVRNYHGVDFVNDSKATNVNSTCFALRSIKSPLYLIAGGRDKGAGYEPLIEYGRDKIQAVVVIGEARAKIHNALGREFQVIETDSLEEAVHICFDMAFPGETVLLSPACASFDMFEDFEHRGRVFKEIVMRLKNGKTNDKSVTS